VAVVNRRKIADADLEREPANWSLLDGNWGQYVFDGTATWAASPVVEVLGWCPAGPAVAANPPPAPRRRRLRPIPAPVGGCGWGPADQRETLPICGGAWATAPGAAAAAGGGGAAGREPFWMAKVLPAGNLTPIA